MKCVNIVFGVPIYTFKFDVLVKNVQYDWVLLKVCNTRGC